MAFVRVKQKFQVTIPTQVRNALNLQEGDLLEVEAKHGAIVLHPRSVGARRGTSSEDKQARFDRMMASFGAGKGLFRSAKDVDELIRRERESWDD